MKNIDIFFTTAMWEEYEALIIDKAKRAEERLKGLIEIPDECAISAITICFVCMFDDESKDNKFGKKMESITPWGTKQKTSAQTYNVGIALSVPSDKLARAKESDFVEHCIVEFNNKTYIWNNRKLDNFDNYKVSRKIFEAFL